TEPSAALTRQYEALLRTEGLDVTFTEDGIERIAEIAFKVNEGTENIGARRLHTVMERLLEEASFKGSDMGDSLTIDAAYVDSQLGELAVDEDLSRYIL
ncbi:HslU--HslV peptidase ATPase subunit, partial [Halomonas sabkhae]|nr:HslU--HslV peptidase ATPase subunit [Halomonas sabkhae]